MARCDAGCCTVVCSAGCYCVAETKHPDIFWCDCDSPIFKKATNKAAGTLLKQGKKIPFTKSNLKLKVTSQGRYDICAHNVPITTLAQSLDRVLPNRILVPANNLTKNATLNLKNKSFKQIIIAAGLALKS
jgi:hypothetical protein